MSKGFKMFVGLVSLTLCVGGVQAGHFPIVNDGEDSTKVEKAEVAIPETSIIDEVIWVIGDEPILKSDVEAMRLQSEAEGVRWQGDPDCSIPEQMAVQKLFLHQAAIDSIEVTESEISQVIEDQINYWAQIREEGIDKVLEAAGFEIRQPGCSACLAMNDDKIPAGKLSVSTSNRNFEGRQGPGSRTILASPLVAAASAITGVLTDPRPLI